MSILAIPNNVKKVLQPGEEVQGYTATFYKDFYATNKRILSFEKPPWLGILILAGVLPYFLALLIASKAFNGEVECSNIATINFRTDRTRFIIVGLIMLVIVGGLGLFIIVLSLFSPYKEAAILGIFFLILGVVTGGIVMVRKASYWQIELKDQPGERPAKWRIPKTGNDTAEFTDLVAQTAAVKVQ